MRIKPYRIGQIVSAIVLNAYILAYLQNKIIYQGFLKSIPEPVLNCYGGPLSVFACPMGSLQQIIGTHRIPFYILGFFVIIGILVGRMACAWVCPFGLLQDLLYKIKSFKFDLPKFAPVLTMSFFVVGYLFAHLVMANFSLIGRILTVAGFVILGIILDNLIKWRIEKFNITAIKYLVLIGVAVIFAYYTQEPWFCKLCPQGTLEAGIPLVLWDPYKQLRQLVGWLYYTKISILVVTLLLSIPIKRPFCRAVCPIGAIYAPFNKFSLLHLKLKSQECKVCRRCEKVCPMGIEVHQAPNQLDCIRCFECVWHCRPRSVEIKL
ncbi:MAG: 4Fe-4S binding protein [candidate division WOR-3 bacterium]